MFLQANYALEQGDNQSAADVFRRHGDAVAKNDIQKAEIFYAAADGFEEDSVEKSKSLINLLGGMIPGYHKTRQENANVAETESETIEQNRKTLLSQMKTASDAKGLITDPKEKLDFQLKLTNQYLREGGDKFNKVDEFYKNIMSANNTGVGSLTTILSYMKIIDPTSVVSGNEVLTAKNAPGGWSTGMVNLYNRTFEEGQMTERAFKQFKQEAKRLRDIVKKKADVVKRRYGSAAASAGLDTTNMFNPEEVEKITTGEDKPPATKKWKYDPITGKMSQ